MKRAPKAKSQVPGQTDEFVVDTAAGCRDFAAADLARACLMDTSNARRRLESSALSWTNRALLIERPNDTFEQLRARAEAEWRAALKLDQNGSVRKA
jgi:hypothetical protein